MILVVKCPNIDDHHNDIKDDNVDDNEGALPLTSYSLLMLMNKNKTRPKI